MSRKRSFYAGQRSRDNTNGGIGMAMFKKEEREKAYRERFKPYRIHKTVAKALTRAIKGTPRRRK